MIEAAKMAGHSVIAGIAGGGLGAGYGFLAGWKITLLTGASIGPLWAPAAVFGSLLGVQSCAIFLVADKFFDNDHEALIFKVGAHAIAITVSALFTFGMFAIAGSTLSFGSLIFLIIVPIPIIIFLSSAISKI